MTLTYIDSGVLIAAARGLAPKADSAFRMLTDRDRLYASSVFVQLEVLPKSTYHNRAIECELYKSFFQTVTHWAEDFARITKIACEEANLYDLDAIDALHIAAAFTVGATELVTIERPDKPIYRTKRIRVVSIN
jgi:predicted nucleic acid-binding protein